MAETMTVNDALWRIVELASRSSDPRWRGDSTRAMHDLEAAVHEIGTRLNACAAGLDQARAAAEEAGAQARAARGQRDRECARAAQWEARANEAVEAMAAMQAQMGAAEADRDDDLRALRRAHQELSIARAALAGVEAEKEEAEARRLAALKARRVAESERDAAVGVMERRPPVADLEVDVRTPGEVAASEIKRAGIRREAESSEPAPSAAKPRLLHVAATLGHLLPDDMDALLMPGARVVRREGRLAALVALPGSDSLSVEHTARLEEEQAARLRKQGFRVEWSQGDRLAS